MIPVAWQVRKSRKSRDARLRRSTPRNEIAPASAVSLVESKRYLKKADERSCGSGSICSRARPAIPTNPISIGTPTADAFCQTVGQSRTSTTGDASKKATAKLYVASDSCQITSRFEDVFTQVSLRTYVSRTPADPKSPPIRCNLKVVRDADVKSRRWLATVKTDYQIERVADDCIALQCGHNLGDRLYIAESSNR